MKYTVVYLGRDVREKFSQIGEDGRCMFTTLIFDNLSFLWYSIFIFVFFFTIFYVAQVIQKQLELTLLV